jgi:EmrB/QacA subfamily drug resistance transporter
MTDGSAGHTPEHDPALAKRVLAIASAATFVAFLDVTIVNVAFPSLHDDFSDSSLSLISWVVSAYAISFAALLTPAGRIADVVGRREIFLGGFALFIAASGLCAIAPSVEALIAMRVLQGAGAAMMIPAGLGLILAVTAPERRTAAIGAWGAATSLAAVAGPAVGGVLVEVSDWRAVFAVNVPIGLAVIAIGLRQLPSIEPVEHRLPDLLGTGLLIAGFSGIAVALTEAGEWGWGDTATLAFGLSGLALLALSLRRAASHPAPALAISLWRERDYAIANAAMLFFGAMLFAWLLVGILFLTGVWGYSVLEAGLASTPGAFTSAVAAAVAGRLTATRGPAVVVVTGAALLVVSGVWFLAVVDETPNFLGLWLPAGAVLGLGFGSISVGLTSAAAQALPPERFAAGVGLSMTARQLGGALGIAVLATILSSSDPGLPGMRAVYWFCIGATVVTALIAATLGRPARAPAPGAASAPAEARS